MLKLPKQSKYPKSIYFAAEKYKIKFVKGMHDYGSTSSSPNGVIKIKAGMSPRQTFMTFIHELLHVVEFETPLKLSHKTVYELEKAISDLLFDNFF